MDDVKLNRKYGIFLLRASLADDAAPGGTAQRSLLVIAGGANRARFLARLDTGDDRWEGPECEPEFLGLAERSQGYERVQGRMGDW